MGTQQILLIVLSVIIVGVAIAVGITMFNTQAYNANKSAVASELTTYATNVVQWWKTPKAQGGAGQDTTAITQAAIAQYIGFATSGDYEFVNQDTGEFRVTGVDLTNVEVTLEGVGKEQKKTNFPHVTTTVTLPTGEITATTTDDTGF